jgi:hypothetical protein
MTTTPTTNPYGGMRPEWAFPRSSGPTVKAYRSEAEKDAATLDDSVTLDEFKPRVEAYYRNAEALHRARCIGEGLVRARMRMERCAAWLWRQGACSDGMAFVRRHRSPEAAMLASAAANGPDGDYISWVIPRLGELSVALWGTLCDGRLDTDHERERGWPSVVAVTKHILASHEWRSLPWQRDPEVSRG